MSSGVMNDLRAVWGDAPDDVFVAGFGDEIPHFDGTEWSPMPFNSWNYLFGFWGASGDEVFAVGGGEMILRYMTPPFFADGFESGDTSGWSISVP